MTAYIKMIDIWMIFTMMYPFSVVALYSVQELLKSEDLDITVALMQKNTESVKRRAMKTVNNMLDYGLPLLALIFIILFWVLGIANTTAAQIQDTC